MGIGSQITIQLDFNEAAFSGADAFEPLAVQFDYPEPERLRPHQSQDNRFARDHRHAEAPAAAVCLFADSDVKRVLGTPNDRIDVQVLRLGPRVVHSGKAIVPPSI